MYVFAYFGPPCDYSHSRGRLPGRDTAVVVNGRIVEKIVARTDMPGFIRQGNRISYRHRDMSRER